MEMTRLFEHPLPQILRRASSRPKIMRPCRSTPQRGEDDETFTKVSLRRRMT